MDSTSVGNCLMMMVMASPKAKPRSAGRDTKLATPPRRNSDARPNNTPTINTASVASVIRSATVPPRVASEAAKIAAEEEVAETIANRLRPKIQ